MKKVNGGWFGLFYQGVIEHNWCSDVVVHEAAVQRPLSHWIPYDPVTVSLALDDSRNTVSFVSKKPDDGY